MPVSKGHLNPGSAGVTLHRFELDTDLADVVRHVWIARWDLPDGYVSSQRILTYPAFNLAFTPEETALHGPDPHLYVQELSGRSWAVGLLLRPAAGLLFASVEPARLVGTSVPVAGAPSVAVQAVMESSEASEMERRLRAVLEDWLWPLAGRIDERGRLVNEACRLAEEEVDLVRVDDLAQLVGLSRRSLERLVLDYVGVTPKWLIECRRLQEAASLLHRDPNADLTALAVLLRYVDYAHFSRRYKRVLGETPDETRAYARASSAADPAVAAASEVA